MKKKKNAETQTHCILVVPKRVLGMINAKYLAFGTPDASTLLQLYFLSFIKLQDFIVANIYIYIYIYGF